MSEPATSTEPHGRSCQSALILSGTLLAVYLTATYVFSYSQAAASPRHAVHTAIFLMDAVILTQLLVGVRRGRDFATPVSPRRRLSQLFLVLSLAALLLVALLHADYLFTRFRGAEETQVGTLLAHKTYIVAAQLATVLCLALLRGVRSSQLPSKAPLTIARNDLLLFSLALTPLLNYLVRNGADFSVITAIEYLAFFLAIPLGVLLIAQVLERALGARQVAAPLVVGLAYVYYSMPMVSAWLERPVESLFATQMALALIVPGIVITLYLSNRVIAARAIVFFTVVSVTATFAEGRDAVADAEALPRAAPMRMSPPSPLALSEILASPARRRPDVYLLVYDGYAAPAMMEHYGLADEATPYLESRGFTQYENAYSVHLATKASMSSLMDMRYFAQAPIGGATTAGTFFERQGYTTHLVLNSYLLQGSDPFRADVVFPAWSYRAGLSALYRGIGGGEFKTEVVFQDSGRDDWLTAKRQVLSAQLPAPKMLYAHSGFPGHSQNSGRCLEDETKRHAARLAIAYDEMIGDIETILNAEREAIIIVAGDHGPYLTGDCLYMARRDPAELSSIHLGDRYGTRLAIRWPDPAPPAHDRITVLQDVFFAVAAYMVDDERVWLDRISTRTIGYGGIPSGAVADGIVRIGKDKGRHLLVEPADAPRQPALQQ